MRDILKIIAIGSLIALEKRRSKKGLDYVEGRLLCRNASQQIAFTCFSKEINQRLLRENLIGERVKITGSIRTKGNSLFITIFRFERAKGIYDRAEFAAIGVLKEIAEQGRIVNLAIEARTFFQGQNFSNILEIKTLNKQHFKQRLLTIKGKRVLAKGILRQVDGGTGSKTICWLDFLDVLRERILKTN